MEAMMEKTQCPCYTENGGDKGMSLLRYTFMNDTLFKMLFTKYPMLLKRLTSELLGMQGRIILIYRERCISVL
jgi:hypothetical protein